MIMRAFWHIVTLVGIATLGLVGSGFAQPVEEFYRGRTISLIVSFGPGGLNDIAGRLVAQHLGRFIPGRPNIIVQNMPGAGGLNAANHLYNIAAKDGSVLGQLDRSVAQSGFRQAKGVRFDPLKFTWLGSLSDYSNEAYLLWVNSRHPAQDVAGLAAPGVATRIGVVTGGTNMLMAIIARDVLRLKIQVVRGYPAASAIWLAMQREEVDGQIIGLTSVMAEHPEMWSQNALRPLVQFGRAQRHDIFKQVPTARELAANSVDRALIEFAELPFTTSLPFVAPPDLPSDRAAALRAAFAAMVRNADFIDAARKRRIELSPIGVDGIMAALRRAEATPPAVVARLNAIVESRN